MSAVSLTEFLPHTATMVAQLKQLVEIESPSTNKAAVDRLGQVLQTQLTTLGAQVVVVPQTATGNHLVATWATAGTTPPIVLLCHMDTVYDLGTLARQPCVEKEGRLHGPGTMDMKASIVIALTALEQLRATGRLPQRPIKLVLTSDEEIGSATSQALLQAECQGAALVLCLEPALPDGALKIWRKGVGDYALIAHGRATHAGADHENGVNAIEELAHHVLALQRLTDYARGTTLNVGTIQGGTRTNVVPDEARLAVDLRVLEMAEAARVEQWLRQRQPVLPGATLTVHGGLNRPPMPLDAAREATFERARLIGAQLGLTLTAGGTGGGSDANFVAPLGIPLLDGLGALGNGAHSEREYITIASLPERAALLAALLTAW